ncbi:MAG: substrate-binding domain-containing protein, partial [Gemmatimonadota bacterium]|nr:substrate-binding domain-containing protein [Gemmatimonadota bacterium]
VRQTEGAVGYVEQVFARQNNLPMAAIRNQTGQFVQPAIEATVAAASGVMDRVEQQGDFRISIVNAPDPAAYPIASWTYLLIPPHMDDCGRARALRDVVQWALSEGDAAARELHYAPLPDAVSTRVLERLGTVTCGPAREPLGGDA